MAVKLPLGVPLTTLPLLNPQETTTNPKGGAPPDGSRAAARIEKRADSCGLLFWPLGYWVFSLANARLRVHRGDGTRWLTDYASAPAAMRTVPRKALT